MDFINSHHRIFDEEKVLLTVGETCGYVGNRIKDFKKIGVPTVMTYTEDMEDARVMCRTADIMKFIIDRRRKNEEQRLKKQAAEAAKKKVSKNTFEMPADIDATKPRPKGKDVPVKTTNGIPKLLTTAEVADIFRVKPYIVGNWARHGGGPVKPAIITGTGQRRTYLWKSVDVKKAING